MDRIHNLAGELSFPSVTGAASPPKPSENELIVMEVFEEFRTPLLRYALSFGLPVHDAEEIVQEVFLALFRHLQAAGSRKNLRGWIFRVTHNLAVKQRTGNRRWQSRIASEGNVEERSDPSPNPEECMSTAQRQRRMLAVVDALSVADRSCLHLRAEGLRYREIAGALGMSLGAVSISLTRSLARLMRATGGK